MTDDLTPSTEAPARRRPKPGERRIQILQTLASMLEQPSAERVTTAALAGKLDVSEAALYRHFASKAQMFEALIDFIEQSVFTLINQIAQRPQSAGLTPPEAAHRQVAAMVTMLLQFAEKNPGMARVMVGDALVLENERLQQRMNLFFDKIEASFKQCLQDAPGAATEAGLLSAFATGRLQRFVRTGFRRLPTENLEASLGLVLG